MKKPLCIGALALPVITTFLAAAPVQAQTQPLPTGIQRTALQRHDLTAPGRETVQTRIDFEPGAAFGRHQHPGEELIYVLEGALQYQVDGQPPVTLHAGEVLFIPAGTMHAAKNIGKTKASELATYIVEKGKPILTLAQE
ncbi:cupin domain-containing protein [Hymenobacter metallicola]|uniref:Cupin domain-containing protein n=1 Tax=Hymenobacter metallicola TaxID=2563114 RepID=A0A4Z0PTC6_9BACT|nr:cupin domain-containing protein [Hymenobacter metallicola]TGE20968.1 cupin domain-containing protein [Hymenobacter metallicola]